MPMVLRPRGRPQIARKCREVIVGSLFFGKISESLGFERLSAEKFKFYATGARTDQSAFLLLFITYYWRKREALVKSSDQIGGMSNKSNLPQAMFRFLFFAAGAGAEVGVVWSICGELKETEALWTNGTVGTEKPVIAKISDEIEGAGSLDAGGRHCGDAGRR